MFPTLSEALTGQRMTVGPPFFNTWMLPIGLALLFLTGVGPLLAWRRTTPSNLKAQFLAPVIVAVATPVALALFGVSVWPVGMCFCLSAFVAATIVQEFIRGAGVRRRASGANYFVAMVTLVARSKRRYGGYLVHLSIVLMFVGFAGEAFKVEQQVLLKLGQQVGVGHYVIRNDGIRITDDGQKQMITAHLAVLRDGREIDRAYPGKWLYRQHEQEPVSQVAIRRGIAEDLYIVLPDFELQSQSVTLQVVINPLVDWIWVGFCLLLLGTLMALLPEELFSPEPAKMAMATVPVSASDAVDRERGSQGGR
jgi:cytochrome c-type biogenesis protein CcmF